MIHKASYRCIPEDENYWGINGRFVHLFVIQIENGFVHFARGNNERLINLNGYAWEKEFKEMENEITETQTCQ